MLCGIRYLKPCTSPFEFIVDTSKRAVRSGQVFLTVRNRTSSAIVERLGPPASVTAVRALLNRTNFSRHMVVHHDDNRGVVDVNWAQSLRLFHHQSRRTILPVRPEHYRVRPCTNPCALYYRGVLGRWWTVALIVYAPEQSSRPSLRDQVP